MRTGSQQKQQTIVSADFTIKNKSTCKTVFAGDGQKKA